MFVWQGPAPNLDPGPFGPPNPEPRTPTQNPKALKYCFLRVSENILISSLQLSCLLQILQLIEPKKMSNLLGSTHVFHMETSLFLWYCVGSCCALQNSTPNMSTPNILSCFFPSTPEGLEKCIFYVGGHAFKYIYIYLHIYLYIYIII